MGLGSTAKKVQRLSDLAEKLYKMVNELLDRVGDIQERVEESTEDLRAVRRQQREQRALLEALAEKQGVDVEAVVAEADGDPGGSDGGAGDDGETGGAGGDVSDATVAEDKA
jgi:predicted transcriptional regulator